MNENDFLNQQQAAVERMRQMSARANVPLKTTQKMPPAPNFVKVNGQNDPHTAKEEIPFKDKGGPETAKSYASPLQNFGINIPFLDQLFSEGDSTLILGLLLILMSEKSDKLLIYALIYILL